MPRLTLHLKPRPSHPTFGTAWIPHGPSYGPFTSAHGSFPSNATEGHEIEFEIPSFDSAPLPDLYASRQARMAAQEQQIYAFLRVVMRNALTLYGDLPIVKKEDEPGLSGPQLCCRITDIDLHSEDDTYMEFKIWVGMMEQINDYLLAEMRHGQELNRRCSRWDKLVGAGTYYTRTSPKYLAETPLILSPETTSSEPIFSLGSMGQQNLSPSSSSSGSEESEPRSPETPSPELPPGMWSLLFQPISQKYSRDGLLRRYRFQMRTKYVFAWLGSASDSATPFRIF
ncbi:hypothetical protein C8R44DRAFT_212118 [Mycena epipterygia]|nr:hypothetical protein C8R44DRAFT_212118 [Mycena epipterygia]